VTGDSVSVVIPTHDRREFLGATLGSVLRQKDVEFDVTVIDDGSTDDTAQFLETLRDPRVRVIRNDVPKSVAAARNQGIAATTGNWLAFVDDDDLWAPDKLALQVRAAREADRQWVYTGAVEIDARGRAIAGSPPPPPERAWTRLPHANLIPGGSSGVMASRQSIIDAGGWDPGVFHADWDLWIRLGMLGPPACVPEPLVAYRIHGGQSSVEVDRVLAGLKAISARYGAAPARAPIHHYIAFLCYRSGRRWRALAHFALAALFGEPVSVARNLSSIVRMRLARRFPVLAARSDPQGAWKARAEAWLSELRGSQPAPP
jgi:glycosyltransferase involved in cell wall biosynthesis